MWPFITMKMPKGVIIPKAGSKIGNTWKSTKYFKHLAKVENFAKSGHTAS